MASSLRVSATRVPRRAVWDTLFVSLSGAHAAVLALAPPALVVGVLLWWNANTISHNFIHRPFFRRRAANRAYSAFLTLLLGFPQTLWRERHLRHHTELGASKTEAPYVRAPAASVVGRSVFEPP
jgi:fatty acid desaturase